MTPNESYRLKAEFFINSVINKSTGSFDLLMSQLKTQSEKWETEYSSLSRQNVFDMTDQQLTRKGYLSALIDYAKQVLRKFNTLSTSKEKTITITGTNLKIKWQ